MTSVFLISVLLCLSSGLLAANEAPPCPPGWNQFGSRCFAFCNYPMTWLDAETTCIAAGGNLASVRSDEEQTRILDFVRIVTYKDVYYWIGGNDLVKEGTWVWTDGAEFKYTNWNPLQPDNYKGENCAAIKSVGGKWMDMACTKKFVFMCSKDLGN